jgi:hypothetical protein
MKGFLVLLLVISGIALAGDGDAPQDQPARFKITMKRKDDGVEVRADKGKTVFAMKSPFGIGQAVIERQEATWPKAVVLRLHLKGLSSFRASNGKVTLDAVVSVQDGEMKVRMWKDGKEDAPPWTKKPPLDGHPHRRWRRQTGQGASVHGRVLRDGAAEGVFRERPEGGHATRDRLPPWVNGPSCRRSDIALAPLPATMAKL